jgi:hypothetical protein
VREFPQRITGKGLSNRSSATPETDSQGLALVFWVCIGANLVCSLYDSIEARGLYSDGVAYLVGLYKDRWFLLFDTRTVVQVLRQAPVVFASRYTSASLFNCGQIFSFVMLTLPWVFCVLCWCVLPKNQKQWIVFPLLATLAGFMATSVHAVGEAAIATAYEWLILLLVVFRARSIAWMLLWILLLLPAFRLHEGTFIFLAAIAVTAVMACRSASSRLERIILGLGALILIGTIADQIWWVVHPQFPGDRAAIADGFLHGEFLYYDGHFNLQLVNGAAALLLLTMLAVAWIRESRIVSKVAMVAWVLFCIGSVISATMVEQNFAPFSHLQARYHPPLVSTILALMMLVLVRYSPKTRFLTSPTVLSVIVLLGTIQLVADAAATERWNAFVTDLRVRLANSYGLIPWEATLLTGNLRADINWQLVKIGWVVPYFSIVYAQNGIVKSIISSPIGTQQLLFNPADIKQLPTLRGIDYAPYEKSLLERTPYGAPNPGSDHFIRH